MIEDRDTLVNVIIEKILEDEENKEDDNESNKTQENDDD